MHAVTLGVAQTQRVLRTHVTALCAALVPLHGLLHQLRDRNAQRPRPECRSQRAACPVLWSSTPPPPFLTVT